MEVGAAPEWLTGASLDRVFVGLLPGSKVLGLGVACLQQLPLRCGNENRDKMPSLARGHREKTHHPTVCSHHTQIQGFTDTRKPSVEEAIVLSQG